MVKEPYRKLNNNSWVVTVQENGKDKELFIQFPEDAMNQMGWHEGDTLIWEEASEGIFKITKKETDESA